MTKEEYFALYYPKLEWVDLSDSCKIIQHALWDAYDDNGEIVDIIKFKIAYNNCVPLYNKLKEYEYQIKSDIRELNGENGTPYSGSETASEISTPVQDMAFICDLYHRHFEFIDYALLTEDNIKSQAIELKNEYSIPKQVNYKDQNPDHRKWFVKVLNSKIPSEQPDKDLHLYNSLSRLFDELCNLDCLNSDREDKSVFIYRFSGFNGEYPPEKKIEWKKNNTFLGYIIRCLISDKTNDPQNLSNIGSFFQSKSGKIINLASARNCEVKVFEEQKNSLPIEFVKAVELLRRCGFINVEFTSKRR